MVRLVRRRTFEAHIFEGDKQLAVCLRDMDKRWHILSAKKPRTYFEIGTFETAQDALIGYILFIHGVATKQPPRSRGGLN